MNPLNECKKATSISTFDFSTLYTKFPHKNFSLYLIVENKYIAVNSYGAPWVKDIRYN